jgi:hypothetical protein
MSEAQLGAPDMVTLLGVASLTYLMVRTEPPKHGEVKTYRFHQKMIERVTFRLYPGEMQRFVSRDYEVAFELDSFGMWTIKVHQREQVELP